MLGAAIVPLGALVTPLHAEDQIYEFRGFVEPEFRAVFDGGVPGWSNSAKPDARLNLKIDPNDDISALLSTELDVRYGPGQRVTLRPDAREVWVRLATGDWHFKLGRQLFSWGSIGEYGVIDYLNPQQLPDTAQNWAERKIGIWSAMADLDVEFGSVEFYLIPVFTPAETPAESPWVPDRLTGAAAAAGLSGPRSALTAREPAPTLAQTQAAMRGYFSLDLADLGLGVAHLFDQVGQVVSDSTLGAALAFDRWTVVAGEASIPFVEGFGLGLESAYLHAHDDRLGNDPYRSNSRIHWAARVKGFLSTQLQFELGVLAEEILKANAAGEVGNEAAMPSPMGNPYFHVENRLGMLALVFRFGDAMHTLSATYLTALDDNGHYLNPSASFRLLDALLLNTGAQIFAGDNDSLGRLSKSSNIYLSLRADF